MRAALVLISFFLCLSVPVAAISDPLQVPNNRVGIHITDDHDLKAAAELVNSSGGQWGYVTLVIREDDRNQEKWQHTFNQLREKKLIPLIRLGTTMAPGYWTAPHQNQAHDWAEFLDSLHWVTQNRYVILFNEPNHAKEWNNRLAPHEYVEVANAFIHTLKAKSPDFFILPAGFDAMAPNSATTMEISRYFKLMHDFDREIFTRFDGWTSHAYPNPHFAASPDAQGKTSLRGYRWEVNHLSRYGLNPRLPIFITETGWNSQNLKATRTLAVSDRLETYWLSAFTQAFNDPQVVAVTPFILRYLNPPFTGFSWINPATNEPLPHYRAIQNMAKVSGNPAQIHAAEMTAHTLPDELIVDSTYAFSLTYKNTGQSIWNDPDVAVAIHYPPEFIALKTQTLPVIKPFASASVEYRFTTPLEPGTYSLVFSLVRQGEVIGSPEIYEVNVIPAPSILVKLKLWYKRVASGTDFTLLVYDYEDLVKEISPVTVTSGQAVITNVKSLVPGREYRFVLTKPYYLPRQTYAVLNKDQTTVEFKRLLPYDYFPDGQWTIKDLWYALRHPLQTLRLLSP
jgi:hypothetical protein